MRVAVDVLVPSEEPYRQVQDGHVLGMTLRPGGDLQLGKFNFTPVSENNWTTRVIIG